MEELKIGPHGRVVIPVRLRRALGLEPGAVLVGRVEEDRLILEPRDAVLHRLQSRLERVVPPGVSLADELVNERREAQRRESEEG